MTATPEARLVHAATAAMLLLLGAAAPAQSARGRDALSATASGAWDQAVASWQALVAPTGHEQLAIGPLARALPGWRPDPFGNLSRTVGRGRPHRVVACAIDRPGMAVTQITAEGFLRVHRVGGGGHPLFDQAHEAQQANIHTSRGAVPGVFAVANGHFAPQHRGDTAVVTADDLWLDVGASSAAEVAALGIALLDPVERRVPPWVYAGGVAGNAIGLRAGCAALAAVAAATAAAPPVGATTFLITTQSVFGWPGLGSALARIGPIDALTVTVGGSMARRTRAVARRTGGAGAGGLNAVIGQVAGVDSIRLIGPAVRFGGTLVETVHGDEAAWLLGEVARAAGLTDAVARRITWIDAPTAVVPSSASTADAHAATSALLKRLADLPGVSSAEAPVRDAVRAELPAWAQRAAMVDVAGNLLVAAGPERDTLVVIAHLDEVGYDVVSIAPSGMVMLRARGGTVQSAWEGQPAQLHLPPLAGGREAAPLPGVFVPRDTVRTRRPSQLTGWFGLDSTALVAAGVRVGSTVTAHKDAVRLAGTRFTARALDDRAGSTALIQAVRQIDPTSLKRRVLFVWSTEEETGLIGAVALAARLGPSVRRVHSIDTFVSSDTPLESPHFAFAPLGDGPVLRAIESSSMVPLSARAEVTAIAKAAGIPLQVGLTQGGTDGTAFTFWGAPNVPLSWPGRYSHSPAEVLDLRDVERLASLIAAIVRH